MGKFGGVADWKSVTAGFLAGFMVTSAAHAFAGNVNMGASKDSGTGYYNSDLYDGFDVGEKQDINGKFYVLKLREAFIAHAKDRGENADIKYNNNVITDPSQLPEYLLLKGTPFEVRLGKRAGDIEYEFMGWNDECSEHWETDVSLMRTGKDEFNMFIYFSAEGVDGGLCVKDSYIFSVSQLTNTETTRLLKQYGNSPEVVNVVANVRKGHNSSGDDPRMAVNGLRGSVLSTHYPEAIILGRSKR